MKTNPILPSPLQGERPGKPANPAAAGIGRHEGTGKGPASREAGPEWLLQFYTCSKPSDLAWADEAEPLPEFALSPCVRYRIDDELGHGGMKSVMRARDRNTERNIAMAALRDPSARGKRIARFVREARITAALEHPNIVPIYDIGLDDEQKPYFTMKLLGGETLQSILQRVYAEYGHYRADYPLSSLLQTFFGVCNAVSFAHSRGVIHLDLKPANIQVGDFGEVLVLDWGIARVLEKDPILYPNRLILDKGLREAPSEGVVSGTPGFMSPEQARGEYSTLDESTDIFALGAILYAILHCRESTGKSGGGARQENARVPAALEAVAAKAMSRQPENRYQTVGELARDVRAYVEGYATKAQQAGAVTLLWLLVKRHNVVATLGALSLMVVFAILTVSFLKIRGSEQVALDALAKMKAEQQSKQEIGLLAAPRVLEQARQAMQAHNYDQALPVLENLVGYDKDCTEAWWDLAAIRLGRQEFDQAAVAFSHLPKTDPPPPYSAPVDLQGVLAKYSYLARQGGDTLRKNQDAFVYDMLHADHTAWSYLEIAAAAFFKSHNHNPQTVDFGTIENALRWLNPDAKELVFTHEETPMGLKISIHGSNVSHIVPLAGLPVSVLDASGTGDPELEWLGDAPLISVDLSGSRTSILLQLTQINTLQELRLAGWQRKDYSQLRLLPQLKRVIVAPADVTAAQKAVEGESAPPQIIGG
jgi:tetratricopeptide (TPR) repeat protein